MISYGLIALLLANIGLLMFLAKKLGLATFDFGWSTKKNWLWIVGGFVLGRVVAVGGTLYLQHISDQEATANDALLGELFTGENPLLIFLLIAVAAPIMEEIVFRGGFIGLLFEKYLIVGIISSVAVFSIIHSVTNDQNYIHAIFDRLFDHSGNFCIADQTLESPRIFRRSHCANHNGLGRMFAGRPRHQ